MTAREETAMSSEPAERNHLTIEEIISQAGGFEKFESNPREFEALNLKMDSDLATLTEKYPCMWVSMGKNGFFRVGDSLQSVCEAARNEGLGSSEYAVRFLDPPPPQS